MGLNAIVPRTAALELDVHRKMEGDDEGKLFFPAGDSSDWGLTSVRADPGVAVNLDWNAVEAESFC